MPRLRGTGLGAGMAMGTAAVVRTPGGVPLMPDPPARLAAQISQRRATEIPEVIIVAEELRTALAIAATLSWAAVAGIAVERAEAGAATPSVPTVTGIPGLVRATEDDVLILVDATRGVVLVDPDPIYLAQYTAEHDRVVPRNRIYLDEVHLPAATTDGRSISVTAAVQTDAETALTSGPDALYHTLPLLFDPDDVRRHLADLLMAAAGKPLIIPYNDAVPLIPVVELSATADITLAISTGNGSLPQAAEKISDALTEIDRTQIECGERDLMFGTPRIAAEIALDAVDWPEPTELGGTIERLAEAGATRLICHGPTELEALSRLEAVTLSASLNLMPTTFVLDSADSEAVELLIGAGVAGLVVAPERVQSVKETIRAAVASDCRDRLEQWGAGGTESVSHLDAGPT